MKTILSALIGLMIGWLLALERTDSASPLQSESVSTSRATASLSTAPRAESAAKPLSAELAAIVRVNTQLRGKFALDVAKTSFSLEKALTEKFIRVFALDTAEQAAFCDAMKSALQKLEAMQARDARIGQPNQGLVMIELPVNPKEGALIHDELFAEFARILGPERYAAFLSLAAESFERDMDFAGFGVTPVTLKIRELRNWNDLTGSQWSRVDGTELAVMSIHSDYEWLAGAHPNLYRRVGEATGWGPFRPMPHD